MEIKKAVEIIREFERENDVDRLRDELEDKESELEDLSNEISSLQSQIDECEDVDDLDDEDEVKIAYNVIEDGRMEVNRIKDALKSGVVKNTKLVEKQLVEFEKQLNLAGKSISV